MLDSFITVNFVGLLFFTKQTLIGAAKTRKPAGRVAFRLVELLDSTVQLRRYGRTMIAEVRLT